MKITKKEYNRNYYIEHKELILKKNEEYYKKNRNKILEWRKKYHKEWFEKNKKRRQEQILKYDRDHSEIRHKKGKEYHGKYVVLKQRNSKRWDSEIIDFESFKKLANNPCYYCNGDAKKGIDRIDNKIGYTKENSVSCCKICNYMKQTLSQKDFFNHIVKIYENSIRRPNKSWN